MMGPTTMNALLNELGKLLAWCEVVFDYAATPGGGAPDLEVDAFLREQINNFRGRITWEEEWNNAATTNGIRLGMAREGLDSVRDLWAGLRCAGWYNAAELAAEAREYRNIHDACVEAVNG